MLRTQTPKYTLPQRLVLLVVILCFDTDIVMLKIQSIKLNCICFGIKKANFFQQVLTREFLVKVHLVFQLVYRYSTQIIKNKSTCNILIQFCVFYLYTSQTH